MKQHPKTLSVAVVGLLSVALCAEEFQWKGVKFDLPSEFHSKIRQGIDSVGGEIVLKEPKLTILCDSGVGAGNVVEQRRQYSKHKPLRDEKPKLGDLPCEIWIGGPYPQTSGEPRYDACAYVSGMNFVAWCQGDKQLKVFLSFVESARPVGVQTTGKDGGHSTRNGEATQPEQGTPPNRL